MSTMRASPTAFPETVDTERLHLRRWRPDDREAHAAIWADPDVWESLYAGAPGDPAEVAAESFDRHLRHWEEHGWGTWAAIDPASGELAGWLGASHPTFIPDVAHEIEVGWTLRRNLWGRGLATEGAKAAVEAASTHLAPPRLISLILPTNPRSIAVAERLGMTPADEVTHPELRLKLRVYELKSSSGASPQSVSSR